MIKLNGYIELKDGTHESFSEIKTINITDNKLVIITWFDVYVYNLDDIEDYYIEG